MLLLFLFFLHYKGQVWSQLSFFFYPPVNLFTSSTSWASIMLRILSQWSHVHFYFFLILWHFFSLHITGCGYELFTRCNFLMITYCCWHIIIDVTKCCVTGTKFCSFTLRFSLLLHTGMDVWQTVQLTMAVGSIADRNKFIMYV